MLIFEDLVLMNIFVNTLLYTWNHVDQVEKHVDEADENLFYSFIASYYLDILKWICWFTITICAFVFGFYFENVKNYFFPTILDCENGSGEFTSESQPSLPDPESVTDENSGPNGVVCLE